MSWGDQSMKIVEVIVSFFRPHGDNDRESPNLIKIEGHFSGKLRCGQRVLISDTGTFKGKIDAESLEIHGSVKGDVKAENLLISATGRLDYSELVYDELSVEEGGVLLGEKDGEHRG